MQKLNRLILFSLIFVGAVSRADAIASENASAPKVATACYPSGQVLFDGAMRTEYRCKFNTSVFYSLESCLNFCD